MIDGEYLIGDNVTVMKTLRSESVDLTVTSPPYDGLRIYTSGGAWTWDKFTALAAELYRVTKDGGVVVWNVCDQMHNGSESGNSFRQALHFMEVCGFKLHDTMIYEKAQAFGGSKYAYLHSFEYVFILVKGKLKTFNPIMDRPNVRGGQTESTAKGGMRKDGTIPDRVDKTASLYGKRKNIWTYGVGGGKTGHPAVFPLKFATDHVRSWSNEGDLVLDPFMGSGTTACACIDTNRRWIGIDVSEEYVRNAIVRINQNSENRYE